MSHAMLCNLPPCFSQVLSDWQVTKVSGDDAKTYLQGQLTADLNNLESGQHTLAAHCDPSGKTWSVLRLCRNQDDYFYIQPRSVNDLQLAALKKYAVFSKVSIEESSLQLHALLGENIQHYLQNRYGEHIANHGGICEDGLLIKIACTKPRYVMLSDQIALFNDIQQPDLDGNDIWLASQIYSGLAMLEESTSQQFIPQALNLDALEGISFTKGCYTGQETIARAKYRGANKKSTLRLAGHAKHLPQPGAPLQQQLGENWRNKGVILQAVEIEPGYIELLAVLNRDNEADAKFRLEDDEQSLFTLAGLPYSLDTE